MVGLRFLAFFSLLSAVLGQDTSLRDVKTAFQNANIPRDAHLTFNPNILLEVQFPQASGPAVPLHAGVQLTRNQTALPPTFSIQTRGVSGPIRRSDFVVAMVDLDAPTPQNPTSSQIRHFLGGDFSLNRANRQGIALLSNSTPAISNFRRPSPPAGSDPHRYVFLLFEQSPQFATQTEVNATTPVQLFNISQFAEDVKLGNPLGGTFMLVGPDPST